MLRLLVAVWGGVGAPCRGGTIHRVPHRGAPHTFFVRFTRDDVRRRGTSGSTELHNPLYRQRAAGGRRRPFVNWKALPLRSSFPHPILNVCYRTFATGDTLPTRITMCPTPRSMPTQNQPPTRVRHKAAEGCVSLMTSPPELCSS
jgi:hypothetical protein